jgi:hypothetical protein
VTGSMFAAWGEKLPGCEAYRRRSWDAARRYGARYGRATRAEVEQALLCPYMLNKIAVVASLIPSFFTYGVVVNSGVSRAAQLVSGLLSPRLVPTNVLQSALQPRIFPFRPTQHNLRVLCGAGPYTSLLACRTLAENYSGYFAFFIV